MLLRTCFKLGLRVDCLLAGEAEVWRIRGLAAAFAVLIEEEGGLDLRVLRKLLERDLPGYRLEVRPATEGDHAELIEANEVNIFRKAQHERTDCITYRVRVGDMPGTIWTIVSMATAFDATIVHLSYDRRWGERPEPQKVGFSHRSLVVEFELGLAYVGEPDDDQDDHWTDFEYHVKCVPGYISARIVPPSGGP